MVQETNREEKRTNSGVLTAACRILAANALVAAFLFWPLFRGELLVQRDLMRFVYPLKWLAAKIVASGEAPLWNSAAAFGQPLMGDPQAGVLEPFFLFYLLPVNVYRIGSLILCLKYLLASLAMQRYLIITGRMRTTAICGGILYAFGGVAIGSWNHYQWEGALPFLPLLLATPHSMLCPVIRGLAAGAAMALMFFTGAVEPLMLAMLLWLIEVRAASGKIREIAIGLASAAAFALIQILPTLEMYLMSDRRGGLSPAEAMLYSVSPFQLLGLVMPVNFLGPNGGPSAPDLFAFSHPHFFSTYLGAGALVFAVAGATKRKDLAFVSCAAVVASMGSYMPGFSALAEAIPILTSVAYPVKFLFLLPFTIAVLAAHGIERLETATIRNHMISWGAAVLIIIVVVAAGILAPDRFLDSSRVNMLFVNHTSALITASRHTTIALFVLLFFLLALQGRRERLLVICAVVILDGVIASRSALVFEPATLAAPPALRQTLPEEWPRTRTISEGDFSVESPTGSRQVHELMDVNAGSPWMVRHAEEYGSFRIRQLNLWWVDDVQHGSSPDRELAAAAIDYIICDSSVAGGLDSKIWNPIAVEKGHVVLRNTAALPYIRFYPGADPPSFEKLHDKGIDCGLRYEHAIDGSVVVNLDAPEPGWLYRAEQYFEGWTATRNQQPAVMSRAPRIPGQLVRITASGPSTVIVRYQPMLIAIGLIASAISLVIAVIFIAISVRKKSHRV